jgi:UDP-2-acetamido-2,6-beta-L-arabino-hexul-4-ose reductase
VIRALVTGAGGFIGRNLVERLLRTEGVEVLSLEVGDGPEALAERAARADVVFHLAGVNRPERVEEFEEGNAGFTRALAGALRARGRPVPVIFTSSVQAALENPYGASKRRAEEALRAYASASGAPVLVYRLPNVFGKWCRPNYNSVVATFCHNVARGLDLRVDDPARELSLVYVDDVVEAFVGAIGGAASPPAEPEVKPVFRATVGELAERIRALRAVRETLVLPDLADPFTRRLYATYLSYLDGQDFAYAPPERADQRGTLVELLKSPHFGQIFVSTSHPGVVRGNHYHDTKIEKFCVVRGEAVIRFRHVQGEEVLEYRVSGDRIQLVDIPPGYTHSIENVGAGELVVLFWADEIFDPARPDTYTRKV